MNKRVSFLSMMGLTVKQQFVWNIYVDMTPKDFQIGIWISYPQQSQGVFFMDIKILLYYVKAIIKLKITTDSYVWVRSQLYFLRRIIAYFIRIILTAATQSLYMEFLIKNWITNIGTFIVPVLKIYFILCPLLIWLS